MRSALLLLLTFLASTAVAQLRVEQPFPEVSFDSPVGIANDGLDSNLLYIVERGGVIRIVQLEEEATGPTVFLDIDDRVDGGGEKGLLGLAFHPNYDANGLFYVYYSTNGGPENHLSRVSQFELGPEDVYPPIANPASEVILLELPQPYGNHNGGGLAFGSDGYLYVSLGDGGSAGDPDENGQDESTLLGSILRLDVDGGGGAPDCGGSEALYTIPADNAVADGPGNACDEIYAWGLRNPWRFSFDRNTGDLWIADVGQNQWEEIDLGENGGNYGWDVKEGEVCFEAPGPGEPPCDDSSLIDPVWVYNHSGGNCSITGGYIYRGESAPKLAGQYVYGDYCSGRLWALQVADRDPDNIELGVGTFPLLTTFGEDLAGELYFAQIGGTLYRFASDTVSSEAGPSQPALRLDAAFPNPFAGGTEIVFALTTPGPARVAVYDVLGREVEVLFDGEAGTGAQRVRLDGRRLAAGTYLVRLNAGAASTARRVVLAR